MKRIADHLSPGRENAISRVALMDKLGLSERDLRRRVERERLEGAPILTSTDVGGYYLPASPDDTARFVASMRNRGVKVLRVAQAVKKTMLEDSGQMQLSGFRQEVTGGEAG